MKSHLPAAGRPARSRIATAAARRGTRGLTLLEMVLVLALVVVLVGLAWPVLRRPLATETLRSAADDLRAAWARARVEALESGEAWVFEIVPGTNEYRVRPRDDASLASAEALTATAPLGGTTIRIEPEAIGAAAEPRDVQLRRAPLAETRTLSRPLPAGVTVLDLRLEDAAAAMATAGATPAGLGGVPTGGAGGTFGEWPAIEFYPDGTTTPARLVLTNEFEQAVVLRLRGLTGATAVDPIGPRDEVAP